MKLSFKNMSIYKVISLVCSVIIVISTFLNYFTYIEEGSYSLIKGFPIGGAIVIILAIFIIVGIGIQNKMLSLVSAGLELISNISFVFIIKSAKFYSNVTLGKQSGVVDDAVDSISNSMNDLFGVDISDQLQSTVNMNTSFNIGFYIILIASLIASAMLVFDFFNKSSDIKDVKKAFHNTVDRVEDTASDGIAIRLNQNWECDECGKENDRKSAFCVFCGVERPKPMKCINCGTYLEKYMLFCPKCGKKYDSKEAKQHNLETAINNGKKECKYCGNLILEDANFCGRCGKEQ